jgi:hypothetical protein
MIHRVVVYLRADNTLAHVQSTNGSEWPGLLVERDKDQAVVPLRRIELEIEPTNAEVVAGTNGRPAHRKASALYNDELEYDAQGDQIRYRLDSGRTEKIIPRDVR